MSFSATLELNLALEIWFNTGVTDYKDGWMEDLQKLDGLFWCN